MTSQSQRRGTICTPHVAISSHPEREASHCQWFLLYKRTKIERGSKDTGGDIVFLQQQARQHGWRRIMVLGMADHLPRIRHLLRAHRISCADQRAAQSGDAFTVHLISAEDVLAARYPYFRER